MEIFNNCFPDKLTFVTFAGNFQNFSNWHEKFPPKLQIYNVRMTESRLFERHQRLQNIYKLNELVVTKLFYPSKLMVVAVESSTKLKIILKRLRKSVLWNKSAVVFLIDEDIASDCSSVEKSLMKVWDYNLLQVTYLCYEMGQLQYYTFNPYADLAPISWKLWKVIIAKSNATFAVSHPMTIYKWSDPKGEINLNLNCL